MGVVTRSMGLELEDKRQTQSTVILKRVCCRFRCCLLGRLSDSHQFQQYFIDLCSNILWDYFGLECPKSAKSLAPLSHSWLIHSACVWVMEEIWMYKGQKQERNRTFCHRAYGVRVHRFLFLFRSLVRTLSLGSRSVLVSSSINRLFQASLWLSEVRLMK